MADTELFGNSEQLNDSISRQAAIKAADSIIERDTSGNNDVVRAMTAWKEYIKALPTVDTIPVVRCRDCKHCQYDSIFGSYWCGGRLGGIEIEADFFCKDGDAE